MNMQLLSIHCYVFLNSGKSGKISEVLVKEGDTVTVGQAVAKVEEGDFGDTSQQSATAGAGKAEPAAAAAAGDEKPQQEPAAAAAAPPKQEKPPPAKQEKPAPKPAPPKVGGAEMMSHVDMHIVWYSRFDCFRVNNCHISKAAVATVGYLHNLLLLPSTSGLRM